MLQRRSKDRPRRDLSNVGVTIREGQDVVHIGSAPLVDRLLVITNDAEVNRTPRKSSDQLLLCRIDVLVFVNYEVPQRFVHFDEDGRDIEISDASADDLSVG